MQTKVLTLKHQTLISPHYIPVVYCYDSGFFIKKIKQIMQYYPQDPLLCTVLMHNKEGKLGKKLAKRIRKDLYQEYPNYQGNFFLDSGGFKLFRIKTDISSNEIYSLQKDANGDALFTLDYPINQHMDKGLKQSRFEKSINNAVETLEKSIKEKPTQFVYLAIHGLSEEEIKFYIDKLVKELQEKNLIDYPFGFALGSLVSLKNNRFLIYQIVAWAKKALSQYQLIDRPFHVFGVAGTAIPFLLALGVDTFDSTSYFINAKNFQLLDPLTLQTINTLKESIRLEQFRLKRNIINPIALTELANHWDCNCRFCQKHSPFTLFPILKQLKTGWRKQTELVKLVENLGFPSRDELLIHLSLHNLEVTKNFVSKFKQAILNKTFSQEFNNFITQYKLGLHPPHLKKLNQWLLNQSSDILSKNNN